MLRLHHDIPREPYDSIPFPRHLIAGQVRPWRPHLVGGEADTPTDSIVHAERALAQVEGRTSRLLKLADDTGPGDRPRAA